MTPRRRTARPRPAGRTPTEEQVAAEAAREAEQERIAAARAFRYIMVRGHGCTGKDCGAPEHAEHVTDRLEPALMAMGLMPDPSHRSRYHYGAPKEEQ